MSRSLIVFCDGTGNEPGRSHTNVARLYEMTVQDDSQILYYDPGVGTMGATGAVTRFAQWRTKAAGLVLGHGVRENVMEAYRFLMANYRRGDRIYLFGFSRGAYTVRALAGMLRTVGLLRPASGNLVPYAMRLYSRRTGDDPTPDERAKYWSDRDGFNRVFGNPEFPNRFAPQVHFMGVWDTVKFVGWLNLRGRIEQARWPFTRNVANVRTGRHAVSIDEKRNYYTDYRFVPDPEITWSQDLRELWFAGVHSDVGGTFPDHQLADIALQWVADQAIAADLRLDPGVYARHVGVPPGEALPESTALGPMHPAGRGWFVLGMGWRPRTVVPPTGLLFHTSVRSRIAGTAQGPAPYRPALADAAFTT